MLSNFKNTLSSHLLNIPGWRTNRKIVVIESDDWGSIRMPSLKVYNELLKSGISVDNCAYNRYDSLENEEDLTSLFEVLLKYRDKNGHHPVITANTVVANPDFERIKASGFQEYFYEPFTDTLKRNSSHANAFDLWKFGMVEKIFYPQFHGREHVNVSLWLKLLQEKNEIFLKAFNLGLWGIGYEVFPVSKIHIQASYDCFDEKEFIIHQEIIKDGLLQFHKIFGYHSSSFIANNFIWDKSLNSPLAENGVKYIQGMKYQLLPILKGKKRRKIFHYTGEKNKFEQIYLSRNCGFEPTENPNIDNISKCLNQIQNSFFWKKPAIISTHRLNFIGSIDKNNRNRNIELFEELIRRILLKWPDVEFLTSVELGDVIDNKQSS